MNSKKTVEVPRNWLEGLLQRANDAELIDGDGTTRDYRISGLIGYVQSAESLLDTPTHH